MKTDRPLTKAERARALELFRDGMTPCTIANRLSTLTYRVRSALNIAPRPRREDVNAAQAREILALIRDGKSDTQIAKNLSLRPDTICRVRKHARNNISINV